jgi:ergothioneine biosynthesis protein EgtB
MDSPTPPLAARELTSIAARFVQLRAQSEALAAPLSAEDCMLQSMPDASPVKWHLAHTTWFFETFVLNRVDPSRAAFDADFRVLFNSYYVGIGARHPRPQRGLLSRPSLERVLEYRRRISDEVLQGLRRGTWAEDVLSLVELGIQHEQQHQELILTDLKHHFWCNPTHPAYLPQAPVTPGISAAQRWLTCDGGTATAGFAAEGFSFDNERPAHRIFLEPFELSTRLVTNAEYQAFMMDGGYHRPELWLSDGWDQVQREGWQAPLYWIAEGSAWRAFTLSGVRAVAADEPVCHVSYYEADAFARWAGARLPTEYEWESVAERHKAQRALGTYLESSHFHPQPCVRSNEVDQLFGDVWEWTYSAYLPYPGYRPAAGAVGEYNGKFMVNQMVLRGGSCATPASHIRPSYRNFFHPSARWQFSGIRLARSSTDPVSPLTALNKGA